MKTQSETPAVCSSYRSTLKTARSMQADLINLVEEILLQDWEDAAACSTTAEEMTRYLDELLCRKVKTMSVSTVNLIQVLRSVAELAEKSYRLRCELVPSSDLD